MLRDSCIYYVVRAVFWTLCCDSCIYGVQMVGDEEQAAFMRLAGDDGEIDAYELQDILNQEFKKRQTFVNFS